MRVLGIDTATSWGSIGLVHKRALVEVACERIARQNDPLLPLLQSLLEATNAKLSDLDLVAVATGPGSFTSLRVGVSLAKGLALGLGVPLVGVASLPRYSAQLEGWPGTVCALVSDHPSRAYVALRLPDGTLSAPQALDASALAVLLKTVQPPVALVGPGSASLWEHLELGVGVCLAAAALNRPSGLAVAEWGLEAFNQRGGDDLATLEPLYVAQPAIDPGALNR